MTSLLNYMQHSVSVTGNKDGLSQLVMVLSHVCKEISVKIKRGGFEDALGAASSTNVQGETQKTLDIISNDIVVDHCRQHGEIAALISEEIEQIIWLKDKEAAQNGDYILYFDPLDGSSNLNVNVSVGSIFSIHQVTEPLNEQTILKKGSKQIAALYALYGPSTQIVLTFGQHVDGFTLDEDEGIFFLTNENLKIPEITSEYAINTARARHWYPPTARYVEECNIGENGPRGRSFNMRWVASMVAEVHRILMRGGVFMYPVDKNNEPSGGKLRLLYEACPMAMIVEAAGGKASTGTENIMEISPTHPHQRVGVILGSREEVERIQNYHSQ